MRYEIGSGRQTQFAGIRFGEQMSGTSLALFLVVDAVDNYRVVFAIPELDHEFTDNVICLPTNATKKPLTTSEGPLRIVAPNEKRQARWVRQVKSLTILREIEMRRIHEDSGI